MWPGFGRSRDRLLYYCGKAAREKIRETQCRKFGRGSRGQSLSFALLSERRPSGRRLAGAGHDTQGSGHAAADAALGAFPVRAGVHPSRADGVVGAIGRVIMTFERHSPGPTERFVMLVYIPLGDPVPLSVVLSFPLRKPYQGSMDDPRRAAVGGRLEAQKSFWRFVGIMRLISIAVYVVGIIVGIVFIAASTAERERSRDKRESR